MLESILGFLVAVQAATTTPETTGVKQNPDFVQEKRIKREGNVPPDNIKTLRERVRASIIKQSKEHGVNTEIALAIAKCESNFNPYARNGRSTATGVYQFLDGTWNWIDAPGKRTDYKENIRQFMIWYPKHPGWWVCNEMVK